MAGLKKAKARDRSRPDVTEGKLPNIIADGRIRILGILCKVSDDFEQYLYQIHFVGSLTTWLDGECRFDQVGDIDILINGREMARQFWVFLEGLLEQGLKSVYNVEEKADALKYWNPCLSFHKWHPTALTLDCSKLNLKHNPFNLDINIDKWVLRDVPGSDKWMHDDETTFEHHSFSSKKEHSRDPISFALAIPKVKDYLGTLNHPK